MFAEYFANRHEDLAKWQTTRTPTLLDPFRQMRWHKGSTLHFFSRNLTPSANCLWRAEGDGLMQRYMTSVLFWPSANSLPWREGSWVQKLIIILSDLPRNDDGVL